MNGERKKRLQVNYRVTPEEDARLRRKADAAQMPLAAYCKQAALHGRVAAPCLTPDMAREILPLLGRMSSNINQIARRLNSGDGRVLCQVEGIRSDFDALWSMVIDNKMPRRQGKPDEVKEAAHSGAAEPAAERRAVTEKEEPGGGASSGGTAWGMPDDVPVW